MAFKCAATVFGQLHDTSNTNINFEYEANKKVFDKKCVLFMFLWTKSTTLKRLVKGDFVLNFSGNVQVF